MLATLTLLAFDQCGVAGCQPTAHRVPAARPTTESGKGGAPPPYSMQENKDNSNMTSSPHSSCSSAPTVFASNATAFTVSSRPYQSRPWLIYRDRQVKRKRKKKSGSPRSWDQSVPKQGTRTHVDLDKHAGKKQSFLTG